MNNLGKIDKIQLQGFKSIKKMDLELKNINILIGQNGAGKSNFINFFKFMDESQEIKISFKKYVIQKGGAEKFLYLGSKETSEIKVCIHSNLGNYSATMSPTQDNEFLIEEGSCYLADISNSKNGILRSISDWKIYHFHDTSDTALVKKDCNINDNFILRPQGENLAAFLYSIKETTEYQKIVQTIQRVAPFFQDFILQPDKLNPEMIRLCWKQLGTDAYFDVNDLSDGTLRFICLATLLLQPQLPTTILLDEPELGLHPYALQLLAAMIRSASAKTQIIAATQSVTLANQFGWEDIIIVEQKDGESQFQRLKEGDVKNWLDDYRIGDLWEKNIIGGTPEC